MVATLDVNTELFWDLNSVPGERHPGDVFAATVAEEALYGIKYQVSHNTPSIRQIFGC
jgi:hypothetical protein